MDQLWALAQGQEAARLAVEQLFESAGRSRVHKQLCCLIAEVGQQIFCRIEAAGRERTGDAATLCAAFARLHAAVILSRACVEQLGNPSRLRRLKASIFQQPRKNAQRVLTEHFVKMLEVAEQYTDLVIINPQALLGAVANGSLAALSTSASPLLSSNSLHAALGSREGLLRANGVGSAGLTTSASGSAGMITSASSLQRALSSAVIHPVSLNIKPAASLPTDMVLPMSRMRQEGLRSTQLVHGPSMLSHQPTGLHSAGRRGDGRASISSLLTSAGGEGSDFLSSMPFGRRSVRSSDGNSVQRLSFMRGAGGEEAAVQLMVVMHKQVEVYSAALDSFHSDVPLDHEAQQVTAAALYEPTIDLITGHRGGTVLVYGRSGAVMSASASNMRGVAPSAAASAVAAAQQAGIPLVIRLSRAAVTALHCVPAVELEAASAVTAGPSEGLQGATDAAQTGAAPVTADAATAMATATAAAPAAAPTLEPVAPGAGFSCTADDVLLFTGDALGRVMAVRYSRVEPVVLAAQVFTARRGNSRNSNGNTGPATTPGHEVTGLLYRAGCLLVSTTTEMHFIRVVSAAQQSIGSAGGGGHANGNGNAEGGGGGEGGGAGVGGSGGGNVRPPAGTTTTDGGATNGAAAATSAGGAALPQSSSVNLLSPASSSGPGAQRNGANGAQAGGLTSTGGAAAGGVTGPEPIIRRGTLSLNTVLVESLPIADFESCTALVAIDWPVQGDHQSSGGGGGAAACAAPRGSGGLGPPSASGGLGPPMAETTSLAFWGHGNRGRPGGGAAVTAVAADGSGSTAGGEAAAAAGSTGGNVSVKSGMPSCRKPKFVAPCQGPWRVLSAHMNGQLLMWDVTAGRLQLMCAIGPPGPPIVNIFTFPELGTMVELLSTGHLRVGPLPTSAMAPPLNPLGSVPVWQYSRAKMRAHRGRITAGAALANCVATGSRAGGVKVWTATDLRAKAASQGVAFLTSRPSGGSGGDSGGGGAAHNTPSTIRAAAASERYPLTDHYPHPRSPTSRGEGLGSSEGPFSGSGGQGGPSQVPSAPGSLASTTVAHHPTYPSQGGAYPPLSRMTSGHTSLASHMGVQPSSMATYPFMSHAHASGPESYPMMPPAAGGSSAGGGLSSGGAAAAATTSGLGVAPLMPPPSPPQQHVAGVSTGGAQPPSPSLQQRQQQQHMVVPMAGLPQPPRQATPMAGGNSRAMRTTPFANNLAMDSSDTAALPRTAAATTTAATASGLAEHSPRQPMHRGFTANGLSNGGANGHGYGHGLGHYVRSEDSGGNLSAASSLGGPNGGGGGPRQQQRNPQGMRHAENGADGAQSQPQQQQPQQNKQQQQPQQPQQPQQALARVSTPGVVTTPSRNKMHMTQTMRAVMDAFTGGTGAEEPPSPRLPTVGPIGYGLGEAEAMDAARTELTSVTGMQGGGAGGADAKPPHAPVPEPSQHPLPLPQHYPGPPSPVPARAAVPGTSLLPPAVREAAQDPYGAASTMYPSAPYPYMGPVNSNAIPDPPPHMPRMAGLPTPVYNAGAAGMAAPQVVPFAVFHSTHPQSPQLYGNIASPMMYDRMSEYSGMGLAQQHVPGPQITHGRRPSNVSELDLVSGRLSPFETQDSDDVGLPPPPPTFIRPPPVVTPTTPRAQDHHQLSQNCFIRPEDLRHVDKIGEGAEGIVHRGRWHHIDVAVKEMHPTSESFGTLQSIAQDLSRSSDDPASVTEELAGLIKEVAALIDLGQHPNIIRFIGICTSPPRIVTEYYKMGSLYSMLKEARQGNIRIREKLPWDKRLIMLKDIAAGMAYLHSRDYIHGDLRSPNVFVTEDQHLKIGDFGFARILGKAQNQVVPARLTNPRWQAPEVYDMVEPIATTAADVYSFGIIMYEMLTFRLPYDDVQEDEVVKLRHTFNPAYRPPVPSDHELPVQRRGHRGGHLPPLHAYKSLMMDCWAVHPDDRPKFHKIASRLNAMCRWQWALSEIMRRLLLRLPLGGSGGGGSGGGSSGVDVFADQTPTYMTSVSSPTPRRADQVALFPLQQQQQQDTTLERQLMESIVRRDESPFVAAALSSPAVPAAGPAAPPPPPLPRVLPLLPPLPPLKVSGGSGPVAIAEAPPQSQVPPPRHLLEAAGLGKYSVQSQLQPESQQQPQPHPQPQLQPQHFFAPGAAGLRDATEGRGEVVAVPAAAPANKAAPPRLPVALATGPEEDLEPAPTIASTGSRPLQVPAASTQPNFPPKPTLLPQMQQPAAVGAPAAPPPPPLSQPLRVTPLGPGDSHTLLSPFRAMASVDDDDDEPGGMVPMPTGRMVMAATRAIAAPTAAPAMTTPAAAGGGGPAPAMPTMVFTTAVAAAAAGGADPYAARSAKRPGQSAPDAAAAAAPPLPPPPPLDPFTLVAPPTMLIPPRMASALPRAPAVPPPLPSRLAPSTDLSGLASVVLPVPLNEMMMPPPHRIPVPPPARPASALAPPAAPYMEFPAAPAPSLSTALASAASFQPTLPADPLEMRTAFHMGIGFSIDDDDDEE